MRRAAAVHFTSREEQNEAEALKWPFRSVVIPHGLESPAPETADSFLAMFPALRDRRRLLFLSRIDPKKNIECLLAAFAKVRKECADLALVVCGEGKTEYTTRLRTAAQGLGIADAVVWAGNASGQIKQSGWPPPISSSFLRSPRISALPRSRPSLPGCRACFPTVWRSPPTSPPQAGVAVEATPDAVVEGIRWLLNDELCRTAAACCARKLATARYSAAAMGTALVRLYEDIARHT